jgi:hypothetical protein
MTVKIAMRHQNCSTCGKLMDSEYGFQKSGEGTFLPSEANRLLVLNELLTPGDFELKGNPPLQIPFSRVLQLRRCPECETFYLYGTDYEFIYGGTEDEQFLKRLTDEQASAYLEKMGFPSNPGFGLPPVPEASPNLLTPPGVNTNNPQLNSGAVFKKRLAKIGNDLAEEFVWEAGRIDFKDDRHQYALDDAQNIRNIIEKLLEPEASDEAGKELESANLSYPEGYPGSASLDERYAWFRKQCENVEKCSVCGALPDELKVDTNRGERLPEAFHRLTERGNYNGRVSTFLRCPQCRKYFNWIVDFDMYGYGKKGEMRLTRLTGRASRLLDKILSTEPNNYPDRNDVEKDFDAVPFNLLLQALKFRIPATPEIVGSFVPRLLSYLAKYPDYSDPLGLREMLKNYAYGRPERAEEIIQSFLSLKEEEYSTYTDVLRHCLKITKKSGLF